MKIYRSYDGYFQDDPNGIFLSRIKTLEIDACFTGTRLKPFVRQINWRNTKNYAASINDDNDFYFDDQRFKRLVAHPVYCAAVTWPVVERIWEFIEVDNFPIEVLATQVHYSEHIRFFRLPEAGDRLHVNGKIAAILPHRAGTRVVIRFDVTDDNNLPVFTEHIGSIMRGVRCIGGRGEEALPVIPKTGDSGPAAHPQGPDRQQPDGPLWTSEILIDRLRPYIYDGCSNIVFPIHTSVKFALQAGLPDIILQGTATLAFAVRELVNREAGGNPARINFLYARFSGMVIPQTTIKILLKSRKDHAGQILLHFCVLDQQGSYVVKDGWVGLNKDTGGHV